MRKLLKFVSIFVLVVAQFAANTPSQLGSYQLTAPKQLKKWVFTFFVLNNFTNLIWICIIINKQFIIFIKEA